MFSVSLLVQYSKFYPGLGFYPPGLPRHDSAIVSWRVPACTPQGYLRPANRLHSSRGRRVPRGNPRP